MNVKSKLLLSLLLIVTFTIVCQQSCYGMDRVRREQQQITKEYEQIKAQPEEARHIQRRILEPIKLPAERLSQPLKRISERTNELLAKEQIKPDEIAVLRMDLNEAAANVNSESERAELEKMGERLDIVQSIAELKEKEQKLNDLVVRSRKNFEQLGEQEEKASLWKDIFSGGFAISFIANLIALLGFVIKMPGAKLEKQLKELLIIEKRAKLEQDGIDFKKYI
jgi:myosin heavy subunit